MSSLSTTECHSLHDVALQGDGTEKTWLASLVLFAPFIVVFLMGAAYLLYIKVLALGRL